ncbi:hypothetical protein ACP6PL_11295 [Dapis sp. BLCC M126]|uniref:hypothetical protein n=1 Tax=Dapis sp. BLCC M126 TaxID=3400189 RepID=UPI003CF8E3B3
MEINPEKMSTEMEIIYEQPSLKKYGTMKELTLGTTGSGGDASGRAKETADFEDFGGRAFPVDNRGIGENLNDDPTGGDDART